MSRRDMLLGTMAVAAVSSPLTAGMPVAGLAPDDGRPDPAMERRIDGLIAQMTLEEKVSLLSGATQFSTVAIPRLGVPSLRMADGPNGCEPTIPLPQPCFRPVLPWPQPGIRCEPAR